MQHASIKAEIRKYECKCEKSCPIGWFYSLEFIGNLVTTPIGVYGPFETEAEAESYMEEGVQKVIRALRDQPHVSGIEVIKRSGDELIH